ncbi:MAG TPA: ribosomal protein S18-alanine N-acetyltransferase [Dehalococcoidia bacterium]|nr:ribosomal protein S18-alanine N-acetyltransferase [Dehalococcoidia bacterium]
MRIATRQALRTMRLEDIPQVLEIERESFPTMWPPTAYKRELEQNRLAHYLVVVERNPESLAGSEAHDVGHHGAFGRLFGELRHILASEEERELPPLEERAELVTGVAGLWMLADEAHIVTVAVRESHRRRGIAELLLIQAIQHAQARGQALVTLECRVSNEPALALYEKYGFERVGLRPRYYSDNHEDAYVLTQSSVLSRRFLTRFGDLTEDHERRWGRFDIEV